MLKKTIKIITALIILLAIGFAVYWFFDRQQGGDGLPQNNGGFSFSNLFPFGNSNNGAPATTTPTGAPGINGQNYAIPTAPPRLWQISNEPQSGAVVFNASNTPFVRFVDKATGNIFESSLRLLGLKRISNTTIPKVYEAVWQASGNALVLRYLSDDNETIKSVYGKLASISPLFGENTNESESPAEKSLRELQTAFLPENITSISANPSTGAFSYVVKSPNKSAIFVTNPLAGSPRQIFESEIRDFSVHWVNNTTIGLISKPSDDAIGQFYFIKTDSGRLEKVMGERNGLIAISNSAGAKIFYSESRNNSFASGLFNPKTGEETPVPFTSLPDKCVWSNKDSYLYCAVPKSIPSGEYPDYWYQGRVSFSDTFWRIDTSTGATEFLIDPATVASAASVEFVSSTAPADDRTEIDAVDLILDPNEEYLVFTNKKDSKLWGLKIEKGS
ncbi:MAG: hypothetical protein AAB635_00695 [Patescibacteria group bacterium]